MQVVKNKLVHMANSAVQMKGIKYQLNDKGICELPDEVALILVGYNNSPWSYIESKKPVVIAMKIIEAPVVEEAVVENKIIGLKPSMQETIDMVLAKKKNKNIKEKCNGQF